MQGKIVWGITLGVACVWLCLGMSPLKINGPHPHSFPQDGNLPLSMSVFFVVTTNHKVGKECHPVNWEFGAICMGALFPCASQVNHANSAFVFSSDSFDYLIGARPF